jgi:hypothetical protein
MDDTMRISRLAGEGLTSLKRGAHIPTMKGLQIIFHSTIFLEGAHHVLQQLEREGILNEKVPKALEAPEGMVPNFAAPFVAAEVLHSLSCSLTSLLPIFYSV